MSALHVFDMDGTLLRSTTASLQISRRLHRIDELEDIEGRFGNGEITAAGFALEELARVSYRGNDLREAYALGRALLDQRIEVERIIDAAAPEVFSVLRDPRRHPELDGSDTLRAASDAAPISRVGDEFVMDLHAPDLGAYRSRSVVVHYEPDRAITWSPGPAGEAPFGHVYGYTLEPAGPDRTHVTLTYDWSGVDRSRFRGELPRVSRGELARTLDLLAGIVEPASPDHRP